MKPLAPERSGAGASTTTNALSQTVGKSAGSVQNGESGVSFLARALARESGGLWTFAVESGGAGRRVSSFLAEGVPGLRPGDTVRVVSAVGPGRPAVYRVVADAAALRMEGLTALGLKPDPISFALLSAVRFFGQGVDPRRIRRLHSLAERAAADGGLDTESAALFAAAADDKGLDISPEALRAAVGLADPRSGSHGSSDRRRQRSRTQVPDTASVKAAVADFQGQVSPLSLMNGAAGRSGKRWLVFPLKFSGNSVEICATVRLLLNPSSPELTGAIEYCSIDVSTPSSRWSIDVFGGSGSAEAVVRVVPLPALASGRIRAALEKALSPIAAAVRLSDEADSRGRPPLFDAGLAVVREDA